MKVPMLVAAYAVLWTAGLSTVLLLALGLAHWTPPWLAICLLAVLGFVGAHLAYGEFEMQLVVIIGIAIGLMLMRHPLHAVVVPGAVAGMFWGIVLCSIASTRLESTSMQETKDSM